MPAFFCLRLPNLPGEVHDSPVHQAIIGERLYRAIMHLSLRQPAHRIRTTLSNTESGPTLIEPSPQIPYTALSFWPVVSLHGQDSGTGCAHPQSEKH